MPEALAPSESWSMDRATTIYFYAAHLSSTRAAAPLSSPRRMCYAGVR